MAAAATLRIASATGGLRELPLDPRAVAVVVAAVRIALDAEIGTERTPPDFPGLPAVAPAEIVRAAQVHRVTGLLTDHASRLGLPAPVAEPLRQSALLTARHALATARATLRATAALREAGIPALVIKGVALSMQTTGRPDARGAGDVDLLVRPTDVMRARAALVAAGWAASQVEAAEGGLLWRWVSYARREELLSGAPVDVDLHWRIGVHHRPLPAAEVLLSQAVGVEIGAAIVPTLSPSDALVAACMHAHLDRYARLRSLVDIVRLVRLPSAQVPRSSSRGLRRLVSDAVGMANWVIGGVPGGRLSELGVSPPTGRPREKALWERYSLGNIWSNDHVAMRDLLVVYGERARYSGAGPSLLMLASDFALPAERLHPGMGPRDVASAVRGELGDFVQRRISKRPQQAASVVAFPHSDKGDTS